MCCYTCIWRFHILQVTQNSINGEQMYSSLMNLGTPLVGILISTLSYSLAMTSKVQQLYRLDGSKWKIISPLITIASVDNVCEQLDEGLFDMGRTRTRHRKFQPELECALCESHAEGFSPIWLHIIQTTIVIYQFLYPKIHVQPSLASCTKLWQDGDYGYRVRLHTKKLILANRSFEWLPTQSNLKEVLTKIFMLKDLIVLA